MVRRVELLKEEIPEIGSLKREQWSVIPFHGFGSRVTIRRLKVNGKESPKLARKILGLGFFGLILVKLPSLRDSVVLAGTSGIHS